MPNNGVQRIAGGSRWPLAAGLIVQSFVREQRSLVVCPPQPLTPNVRPGNPSSSPMGIQVTCECGRQARAKDSFAGKHVICPSCGRTIEIREIHSGSVNAHAEPITPTPATTRESAHGNSGPSTSVPRPTGNRGDPTRPSNHPLSIARAWHTAITKVRALASGWLAPSATVAGRTIASVLGKAARVAGCTIASVLGKAAGVAKRQTSLTYGILFVGFCVLFLGLSILISGSQSTVPHPASEFHPASITRTPTEQFAPSTARNRECSTCRGAGVESFECNACGGRGQFRCYYSYYSDTWGLVNTYRDYVYCRGGRQRRTRQCKAFYDSTFLPEVGGDVDTGYACASCNGAGFNQCDTCKGRRDIRQTCRKCGGSGLITN